MPKKIKLGFKSDYIAIIDLVPEDELQTGRKLEENINDYINEYELKYACELYKCVDRSQFTDTLNTIKQRLIDTGKIPLIHIEGHGSKEGISTPDKDIILWSDLFKLLREINLLAQNNLFVSSGACLSGYAMKEVKILEPSPLVCLLAPVQEVQAGKVIDAFSVFYKLFLNPDEDLNNAIDRFHKETEGTEYLFIWAQQFFNNGARSYFLNRFNAKARQCLLEAQLSVAMKNIRGALLSVARKYFKKNMKSSIYKILTKSHKKFMMIDIYPENADRFPFNAQELEESVRKK